jgi:SecD/SecF fusion protein
MKNIIYLFIAVIISITLTSSIQKTDGSTKSITLQSTDKNAGPVLLNKSAEIISSRLKLFGIISSEVKVSAGNGQLTVILPDNADVSDVEGLVTSRGDLAFYETFNQSEIADLLKTDNQLFMILKKDNGISSSNPKVGCATDENRKSADKSLLSLAISKNCRFLWGIESKKSVNCLFALKTNEDGKSLLTRSDIDSVNVTKTADNQEIKIQIKLNSKAAKVFAVATKNNLHKAIAIVIDDKVYSWPVVQNVIEGGKIDITGDFTENEAKYYPVIFNTSQLPLSFKILK